MSAGDAWSALGILCSRIDLMLLEADETGLPSVAREDLAVLQRAAQRLTNTFERLLGYATPPPRLQGPVDVGRHLGQPFTSTKAKGRGHGLASVWRGIRAHGASVEVQSGPGRGTSFILTFPAEAADGQRDSDSGVVRATPTSLPAL